MPAQKPGLGDPDGLGKIKRVSEMELKTLRGDLVDLLLQEMRDVKDARPWTQRGEKDQAITIERAERFADDVMTRLVHVIARGGFSFLPVTLGRATLNGEAIEMKITAPRGPDNVLAFEKAEHQACLVFASPAAYQDRRAQIHAQPDQLSLPVARDATTDGRSRAAGAHLEKAGPDYEADGPEGDDDDEPPRPSTKVAKKAPAKRSKQIARGG